jgi:hypothetical protein
MEVSYFTMLSLGIPRLNRPAPRALNPPTKIAPSSAAMIQVTTDPAAMTGPMPGINKNAAPNSNPHKTAPKRAQLAPIFHAVAGIVEADDVLFSMIIATNNREFLDVESRTLELLNSILCCGMLAVNRNYRVRVLFWCVGPLLISFPCPLVRNQ